MNLMEIGKKPEIQPTETADQMKNLPDTTDKWKQLAKEQAALLELVTEERDELQVRIQKMNEFIQKFQERTHKLKMEKQNLFFENHEMQDEIRKLNDEIHRLTTELSETQKLNRSLQQSNDDLRNRIGLKSRREQEQFEEEIIDVQDQNSKLQIQVNKSSVQAVDEAYRKQKEAEKQLQSLKYQAEQNRKIAEKEVQKLKKRIKLQSEKINEIKFFCGIGYIVAFVLSACLVKMCFL